MSGRHVPGSMERQQISGGLHDRFTSQRQREPGSSRGEEDLTLVRTYREHVSGKGGARGEGDLAQVRTDEELGAAKGAGAGEGGGRSGSIRTSGPGSLE